MHVTAGVEVACPPEELFRWVDDLTQYPRWLEIVTRAEPEDGKDSEDAKAWSVDLRAKVGPLARTKRLRMVRTRYEAPRLAVFERQERDGRSHSAWVLQAEVVGDREASRLAMDLRYDGSFWGPVLERLLRDEIRRSRDRLRRQIEDT